MINIMPKFAISSIFWSRWTQTGSRTINRCLSSNFSGCWSKMWFEKLRKFGNFSLQKLQLWLFFRSMDISFTTDRWFRDLVFLMSSTLFPLFLLPASKSSSSSSSKSSKSSTSFWSSSSALSSSSSSSSSSTSLLISSFGSWKTSPEIFCLHFGFGFGHVSDEFRQPVLFPGTDTSSLSSDLLIPLLDFVTVIFKNN